MKLSPFYYLLMRIAIYVAHVEIVQWVFLSQVGQEKKQDNQGRPILSAHGRLLLDEECVRTCKSSSLKLLPSSLAK